MTDLCRALSDLGRPRRRGWSPLALLALGAACQDPSSVSRPRESLPDFDGKPVFAAATSIEAPAADGWETVTLEGGRAVVALPAQHRRSRAAVGSGLDSIETLEARAADGTRLALTYGPLPRDGRSDSTRLDEVVGGFIDQEPGSLDDRRRGQFAGRPAVEFAQTTTVGRRRARAIIDEVGVYLLVAHETDATPSASGDQFFASFHLVSPTTASPSSQQSPPSPPS